MFDKFKWPVKVWMFKRRGKNDVRPTTTKARFREEKEGGMIYEIKGEGKTKPVPFRYIYSNAKGKDILVLLEVERETFAPVPVDKMIEGNNPDLNIAAIEEWRMAHQSRSEELHNTDSWFERHKSEFMFLLTFVLSIVMLYIFAQTIQGSTERLVNAINAIKPQLAGKAPPG